MHAKRWAGRWPALMVVLALAFGMVMVMARPVMGQEPGHGHGPTGAEGILPEGDWSQAQIDEAVALVRRTETVLPAKFGDVTRLGELGFKDFGLAAPGGYEHWVNADFMRDDHELDPEYPETLVFQQMGDGSKRLVAAMFFAPIETRMSTLPPHLKWWPGWHIHPNLCSDPATGFVGFAGADGSCAKGGLILTPMTHVWIVDNGCKHRFAGIDAPGVVCYEEHEGHNIPPGTVFGPGTLPPRPATTATTTTRADGSSTAPPATPVKATPHYTG